MFIHDEARMKQIIDLFLEYLTTKNKDNENVLYGKTLFQREGYKAAVFVRADDVLRPESWNKKMIKFGEIAKRMEKAIDVQDNNFIDWRNKDDFRKVIQEKPVEASMAIYNLFKGKDDKAALEGIVSLTGKRTYDLISTLFYMKNPDFYYPCKPRFFRSAFSQLSMDTDCFKTCTYENYTKFNNEIREIAEFFSAYAGHIDVLDAHSFAWIIGAYKDVKSYIFDGKREQPDSAKKEGLGTVKLRLNQSAYRKNLIEYWDGKCAITGCGLTSILIASHAKPWGKCKTNNESTSRYNGFLLAPNLDRLFDYGLISFDDEGKILISSSVPEKEYGSLGIRKDMQLRKIEEGHRGYLAYHREYVFVG